MIGAAAVVVPVHDEEAHLEACLESVAGACAALGATVATRVVVVLDACTDASAEIAARFAARTSTDVVTIAAKNVGRARAAGFETALRAFDLAADRIWLATTDADSLVPPAWLLDQIALADVGAHAMVGTIRVRDWNGYTRTCADAFEAFYETHGGVESHGHVHGANLGLRADIYRDAGGFGTLRTGEDHALVDALRRDGRNVVATRKIEVSTSARLVGRAPDGFAGFMADFARRVA